MGFYTDYFSTLLKGIRITALKERIEIRRSINNLRKANHILYKSLFEDIEKGHRVTKAIKEEEKLIDELKKSADNTYSLIFNLSTEDLQLLKIIENILIEFKEFSKSIRTQNPQLIKVERDLALTIFEVLKNAENEEREEFKQVMLVINESEEKNRNKFMANIRLAFQEEKEQTILAKFVARAEVRKAKVNILKLQQIPTKIKYLRMRIVRKQESAEKALGEFYKNLQEIKNYSNVAFKELFYIKKRTTLLTLKILLDLNNLREFNENWIGKSFMPKEPIEEKNKKISKIEESVSKHFHIIAQSFRIIISKIQKLSKEASSEASELGMAV